MLSLAQHKVGRTSKQSEGTVCACAQPQVKDTGAPATGDTWAQGRPVSLSCRQTPWATAFHSREAPGPSLALALGFSPPQLEQVPGVCRTGDRAQVPSIWADPRLSLTDALHPQPAPHKVPRAVPGRRRGGHDAAGVSGVCGWRGGQGSPWGGPLLARAPPPAKRASHLLECFQSLYILTCEVGSCGVTKPVCACQSCESHRPDQIPGPPTPGWETLGRSLCLSVPQLLICKMGVGGCYCEGAGTLEGPKMVGLVSLSVAMTQPSRLLPQRIPLPREVETVISIDMEKPRHGEVKDLAQGLTLGWCQRWDSSSGLSDQGPAVRGKVGPDVSSSRPPRDLQETTVLSNLKTRFERNLIYVSPRAGPFLGSEHKGGCLLGPQWEAQISPAELRPLV